MAWKIERWLADVFPGENNIYSEYRNSGDTILISLPSAAPRQRGIIMPSRFRILSPLTPRPQTPEFDPPRTRGFSLPKVPYASAGNSGNMIPISLANAAPRLRGNVVPSQFRIMPPNSSDDRPGRTGQHPAEAAAATHVR